METDEFKTDIEDLKSHCQYITTVIIALGIKQYLDLDYSIIQKILKQELKDDLNTRLKFESCRKTLEFLINDLK